MLYIKNINGVTYTAEFKGINYYTNIVGMCRDKYGRTKTFELAEKLFHDILISPDVGIDDFSNRSEFIQVYDWLLSVAQGGIESTSSFELTKEVENEWACWRLIYSDISHFDYDTVFNKMTPKEIAKANIALDKVVRQIKKKK